MDDRVRMEQMKTDHLGAVAVCAGCTRGAGGQGCGVQGGADRRYSTSL